MNTRSHSANYVLHNNFPHKSNSIRRSEISPVRVYHPHTPASSNQQQSLEAKLGRERKNQIHTKNPSFFFVGGKTDLCQAALISLFIVLIQVNICAFVFACVKSDSQYRIRIAFELT